VKAVIAALLVSVVSALLVVSVALVARNDAEAQHGLTLRVSARPRILLSGGDVRIECQVPRVRTHVAVMWGLDCAGFYRASSEAAGRVIYESVTTVPRRECGPCRAFCVVEQGDRLGFVHATPQTVLSKGIGCPEDPEGTER
jgi:hypothetical protein